MHLREDFESNMQKKEETLKEETQKAQSQQESIQILVSEKTELESINLRLQNELAGARGNILM